MFNESNYPTLRYSRCKKCGHVFASNIAETTDCPECSSFDIEQYKPFDENKDSNIKDSEKT